MEQNKWLIIGIIIGLIIGGLLGFAYSVKDAMDAGYKAGYKAAQNQPLATCGVTYNGTAQPVLSFPGNTSS